MVERLLIHAGAPKTATTFIQRSLHANQELLASHGVYLPMTGRLELEPNAVSHHHLAWALIEPTRYRKSPHDWSALAKELSSVEAPLVILSSEVFSRVASKGVEGGEAVVSAARELCDSVTIVYYVRNQLSLMNSLYGQRVKSLRMVERFDRHTEIYRGRRLFNYEDLLKPWYTSDSIRFVAVPFLGRQGPNPLETLLHAGGVDLDGQALDQEIEEVNPSLGPVGIEAARLLGGYLRGVFTDFDSEEMAAKKLYRLSSTRAQKYGWCDESFWGWRPESARETADFFAASNARFARAAWGRDWDIEMPIDQATAAVRLLDLDPPTVEKVSRFVFSLSKKFTQLRAGKDPS